MSAYVVDTNVPVAANGLADHVGEACIETCIGALEQVMSSVVVLDSGMLILDEYLRQLSLSGQPGPGDRFVKWVWTVQADPRRCERVSLSPQNGSFEEFPNDPQLAPFDADDRKFVAAALASSSSPEILNATDTDWWEFRHELGMNGIRIRFLCPELMA